MTGGERRSGTDRRRADREAPAPPPSDPAPPTPAPALLTDTLTGLFSRSYLEAALSREIARCRRHGVMASIVLVAIDGFKAANDRWGRGVGDAAIQAVAGVIRRQLRATDAPCRYSGDEFAVVLPDTYRSGASLVGERIVAEVRHQFAEHRVVGWLSVTVSVGVSSYGVTCAAQGELLDAAKGALAEAKAAGGNCVSLAQQG